MKLNVHFSPSQTDELYFSGKTSVVIDVLRATTTIITALSNGAKEVIPVNSVEFAMKVSGNAFGGQTLLGGERNTKKIEGFQLGNSPFEYSREIVAGKSIILFTTNGSKAIVKAKFSENLYICSFLNLHSIAEQLVSLNKDVEILCAGRSGSFCIEDSICAGKLIGEILKLKEDADLTDSAKASVVLSKSYGKSIPKILSECEHGKLLIENGFEQDINYCAKIGAMEIIPFYSGGTIKTLNLPHKNEVQGQ
ncbi:MAG: 2-phosphosulfolactate phosphatase [Ignavibacteriales bacterium]